MTGRLYRDYQRDRVGWFFGLTGVQLGLLAGGTLPMFWAARVGWWSLAFASLVGWIVLFAVVVIPVRGMSAVGWVAAWSRYGVAVLLGRVRWSSRLAEGRAGVVEVPDLPPPLDGVRVHHLGPDARPRGEGVAVAEDEARGRWSVSARLGHDGLDWLTGDARDHRGEGLSALLDAACRTEVISEVQILVRACPDDGGEREHWLTEHRAPLGDGTRSRAVSAATTLSRSIHDDLRRHLTPAATRTETFLILVAPEASLRRQARHDRRSRRDRGSSAPGRVEGLGARVQVLAAAASELGRRTRMDLGADVGWLGSAGLAQACRAGFHPDTSTTLADARTARRSATGESEVGVPWALAGPAHAEARPHAYLHDRWQSASVSVLLPPRGAVLGALAAVLAADGPEERRCLLVAFPVMTATVADRVTASREWAADLGDGLRTRAGVRPRAQVRADQAAARGVDAKLVAGAALCRPYAIVTTTVPATPAAATRGSASNVADAGSATHGRASDAVRRLEASIRHAGYASQRLDLAHDTAFAAGCLPLGHSLDRSGRR